MIVDKDASNSDYDENTSEHDTQDQFYQDRRFQSSRFRSPRNSQKHFHKPSKNYSKQRRHLSKQLNKSESNRGKSYYWKKRCIICGKEGCWSTKHPDENQLQVRQQYFNHCHQANKEVTVDGYNAYIQSYEGTESSCFLENCQLDENASAEGFFSQELNDNASEVFMYLNALSRIHLLTHQDIFEIRENPTPPTLFTLNRYDIDTFHGIMPDTGAAKISTAGIAQVKAFMRIDNKARFNPLNNNDSPSIQFGKRGAVQSLGTLQLETIFGKVTFFVLPTHTPFLMCISDMGRLDIYFDNTTNLIRQKTSGKTAAIVRKWGHPWFHLSRPEEI